jgi:pimeloyl-ACP methyl ester carboxylesterase
MSAADAALPLVLVPGLLNDGALFAHQIEALADVCPAITVADTLSDDTLPAMADRLLAAAPPRFALAGLSMGGYVAQEVMRRAPERVGKLALLDTNARADTPAQRKRRQQLIRLSRVGNFKGVTPRLLPSLIHPDRLEETALTDTIYAMAGRVGQEAFARQQTAIMQRPDGREDLGRIAAATLIIVGRQDALTPPKVAEEMARGIAGSELVIIEDCGHLAPLERPQATTALMRRWLIYA